jgi:NAD(P)H-dependent flavin oxidoreductase YrpB (nitropropane dioxygenase family)
MSTTILSTSRSGDGRADVAALCGVDYPIFLAGMAAISGPSLVAAVANAGGMGILGGLRLPPRSTLQWIRQTRELTDKAFGINLVPSFGGPEVFEAQFQVVLQEKLRVLSLFYAERYPDMIARAKDAGMVVMVQVGTVELARKAIEQGADIVAAQGSESGGHMNRGTIGLLALLPAILKVAEGRPVLAAGGITDRDDVRTVMHMGASGVLVGTAFVACEESNAHPLYKQKIIDATVDDTEYRTGYSFGWKYGTPHRVIPNRDKWNLLRHIGGGARAIDKPRMAEKLSLYAGQGVGKIHEVIPAAQRIAELAHGLASEPHAEHVRAAA